MKDFFRQQRELAKEQEDLAKKKVNHFTVARLLIFILFVASFIVRFNSDNPVWNGIILGLLVLFLIAMRLHQKAQRQLRFFQNLIKLNDDEEKRLDFEFTREDTGQIYGDVNHPYASDLDLFGKHSLYRLLNRTQTSQGAARLADWLARPAPLEVLLERQKALQESKGNHAWRQQWQATALLNQHATQNVEALKSWVQNPLDESLRKGLAWKWWSLITLALLGAWAINLIPLWPVGFSLAYHFLILRKYGPVVRGLMEQTTHIGQTLDAYADLASLGRRTDLKSNWWKLQLAPLEEAEKGFKELGNWFSRLDFRANAYFSLFVGIPILWDLICLDALEKWKDKYGTQLNDWLDALANIEAMNSITGHAFAHPDHVLPEIHWGNEMEISCDQIGHPLIPENKRVCNDFELKGTGLTILITGSNMSGKSTFLRTLGVNLVLAQMGCVVTARRMVCTPMLVFTSMRTQDSLEENTSSFYAELKRLRQLIELATNSKKGLPVFYLLDEILKGTNSADRNRGAVALVKQLHPLQASGLVSTHDLELGVWGEQQPFVKNYHFRSDLKDGQITFDYRLSPGTCSSFNASELMRMMGIKVAPDGEK